MLSISSMRATLTAAMGTNRVLEVLKALGFKTTGWQEGKIQSALVRLFGTIFADYSEVTKTAVEIGFNELATGDALTLFSKSRFGNVRQLAVQTAGPMKLTSTAQLPYEIAVGQLIAVSDSGVKFRNTTAGVLAKGTPTEPSTLTLQWTAALAGVTGNVPAGSVSTLVTPLAGVTISNEDGDPWYDTAGKDEQSDASLRRQNATQWARLTVELVAESYENIAIAAGAGKVFVSDQNPRGPGTIDIFCAAETAILGEDDLAAIQLAFSKGAFQTDANWPPASTSRAAAVGCEPEPLDVSAVLYHDPAVSGSEMVARARTALTNFLRLTPIGGWSFASGLSNVVLPEDVVAVLRRVQGMRAVDIVTPTGTIPVPTTSLVVEGTWTLNAVAADA